MLHASEYHAKNEWFYERYKDGTLDIHEFLDFQLAPLARRPRAQLDAWHRDFMQRKIRPIILPRAAGAASRSHADAPHRDRHRHQPLHHAPIAAASSGVRDLIATDIEEIERRLHRQAARHAHLPRGQDRARGRVARAAQCTALADYESWFYSDSLNDLPLLERVTHPIAVDPDATLRAHATETRMARSSRFATT